MTATKASLKEEIAKRDALEWNTPEFWKAVEKCRIIWEIVKLTK